MHESTFAYPIRDAKNIRFRKLFQLFDSELYMVALLSPERNDLYKPTLLTVDCSQEWDGNMRLKLTVRFPLGEPFARMWWSTVSMSCVYSSSDTKLIRPWIMHNDAGAFGIEKPSFVQKELLRAGEAIIDRLKDSFSEAPPLEIFNLALQEQQQKDAA